MKTLSALLIIGALLWASNEDYDQEVDDNQYWCENIESGLWFASEDEYKQRCE